MKHTKFLLLGMAMVISAALFSCNKNNASAPLPSAMDFLLNQNWRLDTVILFENNGLDTLTMDDVPKFATSDIRFYNRSDSSFIFQDATDKTLAGPDGRESVFRYTYGKWALSPDQDSIYLYSQEPASNSETYKASWKLEINRDAEKESFSVLYTDTIAGTTPLIIGKKVIFAKNSFN